MLIIKSPVTKNCQKTANGLKTDKLYTNNNMHVVGMLGQFTKNLVLLHYVKTGPFSRRYIFAGHQKHFHQTKYFCLIED